MFSSLPISDLKSSMCIPGFCNVIRADPRNSAGFSTSTIHCHRVPLFPVSRWCFLTRSSRKYFLKIRILCDNFTPCTETPCSGSCSLEWVHQQNSPWKCSPMPVTQGVEFVVNFHFDCSCRDMLRYWVTSDKSEVKKPCRLLIMYKIFYPNHSKSGRFWKKIAYIWAFFAVLFQLRSKWENSASDYFTNTLSDGKWI